MKRIATTTDGNHLVEITPEDAMQLQGALTTMSGALQQIDGVFQFPVTAPPATKPPEPAAKPPKPATRPKSSATSRKPAPRATTAQPGAKMAIKHDLVAVLQAAGKPLTVSEACDAFCQRTGRKRTPDIARKLGINLASDKKHFQRVEKGLYQLTAKPTHTDHNKLLSADPASLTDAELDRRLQIVKASGNVDGAARTERIRRISSQQ